MPIYFFQKPPKGPLEQFLAAVVGALTVLGGILFFVFVVVPVGAILAVIGLAVAGGVALGTYFFGRRMRKDLQARFQQARRDAEAPDRPRRHVNVEVHPAEED
jgi:protein-S-isoprenylcysteine O-methyltransferase Ste14